jgi:hypothetical protein
MEKAARQRQAAVIAEANGDTPSKNPPVSFSNAAIERSAFSHVMFELEDQVLDVIDTFFQDQGWTVGTLIYDGMHIQHRQGDTQDSTTSRWTDLEWDMRGAEAEVERKLGYRIALLEKPLFGGASNGDSGPHPKRARHVG